MASGCRVAVAYGSRVTPGRSVSMAVVFGALSVATASCGDPSPPAEASLADAGDGARSALTSEDQPAGVPDEIPLAFGAPPKGERLARMQASGQWADGIFVNPQPLWNSSSLTLNEMMKRPAHTVPQEPVPVEAVDASRFETPPHSGLRVTWLGHSTTLVEIDGVRVLTDPVWGDFAGPAKGVGPDRWYPPPLPLEELPKLDVVLISHDHYDHLDTPTIVDLVPRDVPFIVPLGVGAHLERWGVPPSRITELDWWDETTVGELTITCTPARHASGRGLLDQNRTLWAGYALRGAEHRVFFSGDTGLFPAMKTIGERLGPFDLTMIEVGAYGRGWPDWHIGPEQAVRAHQWLKGEVLLPIHWGLFDLAGHGWTEPIERTVVAAEAANVTIVSPKPGGSFEPSEPPKVERWWPELPWKTAEEVPITSTKVD